MAKRDKDRGWAKHLRQLREQHRKMAEKAFQKRLLQDAVRRNERAMAQKERKRRDAIAALHPLTGEIM